MNKTNSEIIAESGWRETDLRRTYNKKQIIEILDKARASGLQVIRDLEKSHDENLAEVRNSALAEIEKMKQQANLAWYLNAVEKELSKHNTPASNIMNIISRVQYEVGELEKQLSDTNAKIKKLEDGVGKLDRKLDLHLQELIDYEDGEGYLTDYQKGIREGLQTAKIRLKQNFQFCAEQLELKRAKGTCCPEPSCDYHPKGNECDSCGTKCKDCKIFEPKTELKLKK